MTIQKHQGEYGGPWRETKIGLRTCVGQLEQP